MGMPPEVNTATPSTPVGDVVPFSTFTPQEPLVEALRVAMDKDVIFVMMSPLEKSFLVLKLLSEKLSELYSTSSKAILLFALDEQAVLWGQFLQELLTLSVSTVLDRQDYVEAGAGADVIVSSVSAADDLGQGDVDLFDHISLCIVDNGQLFMRNPEFDRVLSRIKENSHSKRYVTFVTNIMEVIDQSLVLNWACHLLTETFPGQIEASCDLLSLLRYMATPKFGLLVYNKTSLSEITAEIHSVIKPCREFLNHHCYSLYETYGEEFQDLIDEIPDPNEAPLAVLDSFTEILDTYGPFCAERAALLLTIKVDKLKTREKYERHFLLYSLVFTCLMKVRKICDQAFQQLSDMEKIDRLSTPKLLRLVQLFLQYKPEHVAAAKVDAEASSEKSESPQPQQVPTKKPHHNRKGHRGAKNSYSSYDDPNALHCLIFLNDPFHAKVLYHFVRDLSQSDDRFSFLSPQYVMDLGDSGDNKQELKKQEDALRKFRMKECNVLISSSTLEIGVENVRCNLLLSLDGPRDFRTFSFQKIKAKGRKAWVLYLSEEGESQDVIENVARFQVLENQLKDKCVFKPQPRSNFVLKRKLNSDGKEDTIVTNQFRSAIIYLNRYCSKLPSDTFTRLCPLAEVRSLGEGQYMCCVLLPINCPLRQIMCSPSMPSEYLAKLTVAYQILKRLQELKEIDDNLLPQGKEGLKRDALHFAADVKDSKQGSTKRRQYYYKQVAENLIANPESETFILYALVLTLNCPIPEEQNTRGRRIFHPERAEQSFGFLVTEALPETCPFPIYTRSGEVMVEVKLLESEMKVDDELKEKINVFHRYIFTDVLRLEKYPMVFNPSKCDNSLLVLPLTKKEGGALTVDRQFLDKIFIARDQNKLKSLSDSEREHFQFDPEMYKDAVVMPWYRNQDQPQYFYVAEICSHLNPTSDFPAQGFASFEKYYKAKYDIQVQNLTQPLLDVDHTSARLNFLTPRYVNRKGVALPSSSEETKKNKRENLDQKQILVPELCSIHPLSASLWRQTVTLPCIFYRLNGLMIADQIRATIAREMGIGLPVVPSGFKWRTLDFGWTLADVLVNRSHLTAVEQKSRQHQKSKSDLRYMLGDDREPLTEMEIISEDLVSKINEEDKKLKKKSLEIGMWSNEMADRPTSSGEEDPDDDLIFDPNIALPDNLTLMSNDIIPAKKSSGGRDWGTGIEQKPFRVASPTFFSNPNINIPGLSEYSDDDDDCSFVSSMSDEVDVSEDDTGLVKVEFKGNNTAEAVDDGKEDSKRVEFLAKYKDEERKMLESLPWDLSEKLGQESGLDAFSTALDKEVSDVKDKLIQDHSIIVKVDEDFKRHSQYPEAPESISIEMPNIDMGQSLTEEESSVRTEVQKSLIFQNRQTLSLIKKNEGRKTGILFTPIDKFNFSFDLQPELSNHTGPSPSLILQAITMSNSNDAINLERLETIGDSFLKYAITTYLYCIHINIHEGRLSHLRSKQVSNVQLYNLGKEKNLGECMIASKFEPHDNWLPPGYHVPKDLEQALIESGVPASHWNMAELPGIEQMNKEEIYRLVEEKTKAIKEAYSDDFSSVPVEEMPSFVPYNLLTQHSIPDKSIADCVEALIGAFLISCGQRGALLFMSWLGIKVLPDDENGLPCGVLPIPASPLIGSGQDTLNQLEFLLQGYDSFEELIGYNFRDRSYLLQAFTHASYYPNRLTDCYQRLEFLGDAVLDYLITRHLYEDPRKHSPGALTDLRSALVNNTIFASMAVKFQFHKYFKHFSPGLQVVINRFVRMQSENGHLISKDYYLIAEEEAEEVEDVEVPKALGDMFESVAGAIFLDSGFSLDTVWQVYHRIMKDEIEAFSTNVPKSPIRELLELEPETAKFGKPEKLADGKRVRVTVEVFGKGVFKGIGRNYRIAKCTAAKCALRALKKLQTK